MIVCDLWAKDLEHYEFNKNILKILEKHKDLKYFGEKSQIERLNEEGLKNIKFYQINNNFKNRIIIILSYIFNILKLNIKSDKEIIILNGIPIIILFCKLFLKKKIYIFLHDLNRLEIGKKGSYRYLSKIIRIKNNKNFKYIVLGEKIRERLIEIIPEIRENVYYIDHPYSFINKENNKNLEEIKKIGTCGITNYLKGLKNIYQLIDKISKEKNKFNYKHLGKSTDDINEKYIEYFPFKSSLIEKGLYEDLIEELDYILILYPINSYKLTASGVYFDCIKFNKPLLGLRNEYFEYMFEKYGEIGKLFDTIDEIIEYLKKDRKILTDEQEMFWKNMKNIRKTLNKNVERDLLKIIY